MVPLAITVVSAASQSGCDRIDRSQWRNFPTHTNGAGSHSTTDDADEGDATSRHVTVDPKDPSGVEPGQLGGAVRPTPATVAVATAPGTCWVLVVDGNATRGCGNARITDVRGTRAGRLTKLSGSETIAVQLLQSGKVLASGSVSGVNRYVTVRA